MTSPDLYAALGVSRDSTAAEIKAAYRREAKTRHPDLGGDAEQFRLLTLAYEILSDPEKRRVYDATGELPEDAAEGAAEARLYAAAAEILLTVLSRVSSPQHQDVLAMMRETTARRIGAAEKNLLSLQTMAGKLPEIANRVQTKEGENLLRALLLNRLSDLQGQIRAARQDLETHKRLLDFLSGYTYYAQIDNILISTDFFRL